MIIEIPCAMLLQICIVTVPVYTFDFEIKMTDKRAHFLVSLMPGLGLGLYRSVLCKYCRRE
jgi:hypothetical protein